MIEQLMAENAALRARIAELTREQAAPSAPEPVPRRDTLDVLRPAMIHWTPEGVVTQWDQQSERLFGVPAAEAIGQSLTALFSSGPSIQLILNGEQPKSRSLHETRDGRTLVCEWTNGVSRDAQGLPREVVSVVKDIGAELTANPMVRESQQILLGLVDTLPSVITVKDMKDRYILVNRQMERLLGKPREEILGKTEDDLFAPEVARWLRERNREAAAKGRPVEIEDFAPTPEGQRVFLTVRFPLYDAHQAPIGLCIVSTDITAHRRAETERAALQEQVIAAQRDALRELGAPLLPVADGVLVMPLLGKIDEVRAEQILEALLDGIGKQRAHTAIIDITGVRVVDAEVASALVRAARAARLLGARVVLTGISPDVARTLVELGADLGDVVTLGTLQSGIAAGIERQR